MLCTSVWSQRLKVQPFLGYDKLETAERCGFMFLPLWTANIIYTMVESFTLKMEVEVESITIWSRGLWEQHTMVRQPSVYRHFREEYQLWLGTDHRRIEGSPPSSLLRCSLLVRPQQMHLRYSHQNERLVSLNNTRCHVLLFGYLGWASDLVLEAKFVEPSK